MLHRFYVWKPDKYSMEGWVQSEKYMAPFLHSILTARIKVSSIDTTHSLLKLPLDLIKNIVHQKLAHSSIPSHWTFFITLTPGIWVLYIVTTSNHFWRNSRNTIHFFVNARPINSITPPSATLYSTTSSNTWGWINVCSFLFD